MNRRNFLRGAGIAAVVPTLAFSKPTHAQPGLPEGLVHISMRCLKCSAQLETYVDGPPDALVLAEMQAMMGHHLSNNCEI